MAVELIVPGQPRSQKQNDRDQRTGELLARFHYADTWRQQYDDRAIELHKLYVGYRPPLPPEKEGRSNLHIPKVYEHVDTIRARLLKTFFGSVRPYIDFLPIPTNTDVSEINDHKAKVAAALVDMQLEKNEIVQRWYDFLTGLLVMPAAILAVGWRYEEKMVRRRVPIPILNLMGQVTGYVLTELEIPSVLWDDNEVVNVDYFDFWPDPRGRSVDTCRFVFHREWVTREGLEERLDVLKESGLGQVFPLNFDEIAGSEPMEDDGAVELQSSVGLTPETQDGFEMDSEEGGARKHLFELLHYWEDDRHAIIVNRHALAYDGPTPYWRHMKKPFIARSWEPLSYTFYGLSAVEIIRHLQEEENTHRNQRIDNVSMVINRMWRKDPMSDVDDSELVSRPHGVINAREGEIEALNIPDVTTSAYNEEQIIKQDMEHALGTPSIVRGVDPVRQETATEIVTKSNNASLRFDVKILLLEGVVKRLAYLMDCNNQQFIDEGRMVRMFSLEEAVTWSQMEPMDIIGEYDYRPASSSVDPAANKEIVRQRLTEVLLQSHALVNPWIDKYELTRAWAESFDLPKRYRIVRDKEQVINEYMRLQQGPPTAGGTAMPGGAVLPAGVPPEAGAAAPQPTDFEAEQGLIAAMLGMMGGGAPSQ